MVSLLIIILCFINICAFLNANADNFMWTVILDGIVLISNLIYLFYLLAFGGKIMSEVTVTKTVPRLISEYLNVNCSTFYIYNGNNLYSVNKIKGNQHCGRLYCYDGSWEIITSHEEVVEVFTKVFDDLNLKGKIILDV